MNTTEILKICKQIKVLLPTYQVPDINDMTQDEITDTLAIYIMQFGNLDYRLTLKTLNDITKDDEKMAEFKYAPIPTLSRETTKAILEIKKNNEIEKQKIDFEKANAIPVIDADIVRKAREQLKADGCIL